MMKSKSYSRRGFLKEVTGTAGLLATAQLPVCGRGKFEQLDIVRNHLEIGATRPFSLLHISDTHLTLAYDRENRKKQTLKRIRSETFGGRQEEALRDSLAWARDNTDFVVHTGDLIDWISEENLDAVKRYFGTRSALFGCLGNHEFSRSMRLESDASTEANKSLDAGRLQRAFPFNIRFDAQVVNGINFVSLEDVYGTVTEDQITCFRREVAKGLPIVLLMHVPLYTERIAQADKKYWRYGSKFKNVIPSPYSYDPATRKFFDMLKSEPLLKAILAGHLHFSMQERFSPTAIQYMGGGNYGFVGHELSFS